VDTGNLGIQGGAGGTCTPHKVGDNRAFVQGTDWGVRKEVQLFVICSVVKMTARSCSSFHIQVGMAQNPVVRSVGIRSIHSKGVAVDSIRSFVGLGVAGVGNMGNASSVGLGLFVMVVVVSVRRSSSTLGLAHFLVICYPGSNPLNSIQARSYSFVAVLNLFVGVSVLKIFASCTRR